MGHPSRSAVLKCEIEAKLASRIPAALSPPTAQALRQLDSGIPEIDNLVGGGLPIGGVTEFTGLGSSGRTSLAYALLARAAAESVCAYIDVDDTMDPRSSASAGISHKNLLWVRAANANSGPTAACPSPSPISKLGPSEVGQFASGHCGSNHPRTETKGLDAALERMLHTEDGSAAWKDGRYFRLVGVVEVNPVLLHIFNRELNVPLTAETILSLYSPEGDTESTATDDHELFQWSRASGVI